MKLVHTQHCWESQERMANHSTPGIVGLELGCRLRLCWRRSARFPNDSFGCNLRVTFGLFADDIISAWLKEL